ncbi:hypothetical protein HAHI6034_07840 [Hathewaya histolytica]|uniref:ABC-2 family transporter protein n=1 Tax=Hathewaya histolytica TaxID=1498 RepID=A0A4U9QTL8_HATHI|nr:hypothetical protein [Hathewaya histolytica]VTQ81994.1 Uncharacterised protein [Hathewaya histolytica]
MNTIKMILRRIMPFYIATFIFIVITEIFELKNIADNFAYVDGVHLYVNANTTVFFLIPYLLIPSLYGYIYYSDRKNGFDNYIGSRISIINYKIKIFIVTFLSCFLFIFFKERIIFYMAVLLKGNIISSQNNSSLIILASMSSGSAYLDSIAFSLWRAFTFSLHAICAVVLSFNIRNFFVIATGGFIYRFLSDLIGTITPFFSYISLVSSESLAGFPQSSTFARIIGFIIFIMFIILVNFIGSIRRRRELT